MDYFSCALCLALIDSLKRPGRAVSLQVSGLHADDIWGILVHAVEVAIIGLLLLCPLLALVDSSERPGQAVPLQMLGLQIDKPRTKQGRLLGLLIRDLALEGVLVDSISADQAPSARAATVDRFREGRIHVLVCTDLMARGIDFLNVQTVINYDFPLSAVDYVHR